MNDQLSQWLKQKSSVFIQDVSQKAPNLLPDDEDVATLFLVLEDAITLESSQHLALVQTWALETIGDDQTLANDWLTLLRLLKDTIQDELKQNYNIQQAWEYWRELDRLFSMALVEASRMSSSVFHNSMLTYIADLRRQMDMLERSKSNFIAVAAHELKTPLTILEGYANMIRIEVPKEQERMHLLLDGVNNGTRRLREIINDMIDVTLIDTQAFSINFQPLHLDKIVRMTAESLIGAFQDRSVELELRPINYTKTMYGDPTRLFQAVGKVLSNSLKYTPDGGKVVIDSVLTRQDEGDETINGYIDIRIRDTGIGIDPHELDAIFEKFMTVTDVALHSSGKTKFKGGGPGLGLPIARGIIAAHGGRMWAESEGCDEENFPGSTFHLELPIRLKPPT